MALENREQLFNQNSDVYRADLTATQNNLGILYSALHDYENSEKYYKLSLENREVLFQQNSDVYRIDLTSVQNNLALMYFDIHDYENSEKFYKLALENIEQLFFQNPDIYRSDLGITQVGLGRLYYVLHDYEKCEKYYKLSLENFEQSFKQYPDVHRANLAMTQHNLGLLYRALQDYQNSEKYFKLALENRENLCKQSPEQYRGDLAMTQYYLASLYRALKDYRNSEKYYKLELEISDLLYQQNPNAETCYNLAINYWNLLLLYADMQNMEEYDNCVENALKLFTVLYESGDSDQKPLVIELKSRKVWRLLQNDEVDVAIPLAEETYAMDESNEQSKYYLAQCYNTKSYEYAKNSDFVNAHLTIDKAIAVCAGNPAFYDTKGELYLMQNMESKALEMWKKIISLYPNYLDYSPKGTNLSNGLKERVLID